MSLFNAFFLIRACTKNTGGLINALFFGLGDFPTSVLRLYFYCTTVQYQASDVVVCGGECRLQAKVFLEWSGLGFEQASPQTPGPPKFPSKLYNESHPDPKPPQPRSRGSRTPGYSSQKFWSRGGGLLFRPPHSTPWKTNQSTTTHTHIQELQIADACGTISINISDLVKRVARTPWSSSWSWSLHAPENICDHRQEVDGELASRNKINSDKLSK